MSGDRHWHGYGPWSGSADALRDESLRRPGQDPNDAQTRAFLASEMPPVQLGHYRLRRSQTSQDRTWTDVDHAVDWLEAIFRKNPARVGGDDTLEGYGHTLTQKLDWSREALSLGDTAYWHYYLPSFSVVAFAVLSCPPHYFHREIPCPLPPA